MSESAIEWTERSWNPIVGCTIKSPGCTHCYAMRMAGRLQAMGHASYQGLTQKSKAGAVWTGKLALNEKALLAPLKRQKPTVYFVNSMGDLFHEDCPDEWIDRVFAVMALCPQHIFQVLTKRSARMREHLQRPQHKRVAGHVGRIRRNFADEGKYLPFIGEPDILDNVWLGVSVEDQKRADERIPDLLATPAAIRFLSCEPLLGPVDLTCLRDDGETFIDALSRNPGMTDAQGPVDWVIAGGESGPKSRPMHPDWARGLRDQCAAAGVPFFFKQWGEWGPDVPRTGERDRIFEGLARCAVLSGDRWDFYNDGFEPPIDLNERPRREWVYRLGKKANGRLLDGLQHDGMPHGLQG